MNGACESNKSNFSYYIKKGWCNKEIMKYLECKKCCNTKQVHVACIRTEGGGLALCSNCLQLYNTVSCLNAGSRHGFMVSVTVV